MEHGYVNYPQYIQSHMNAVRIAFNYLKGIGAFAGFFMAICQKSSTGMSSIKTESSCTRRADRRSKVFSIS